MRESITQIQEIVRKNAIEVQKPPRSLPKALSNRVSIVLGAIRTHQPCAFSPEKLGENKRCSHPLERTVRYTSSFCGAALSLSCHSSHTLYNSLFLSPLVSSPWLPSSTALSLSSASFLPLSCFDKYPRPVIFRRVCLSSRFSYSYSCSLSPLPSALLLLPRSPLPLPLCVFAFWQTVLLAAVSEYYYWHCF